MRGKSWILGTSVAILVSVVSYAGPTTKPVSATTKPAGGRLFAPYSKMNSLSDDQREQIETIHKKALADVKEIEAKETSDIMALLSDDQKKELREIEDKTSADRKTRSSAKTDSTK